jgi:hypothetical protein
MPSDVEYIWRWTKWLDNNQEYYDKCMQMDSKRMEDEYEHHERNWEPKV